MLGGVPLELVLDVISFEMLRDFLVEARQTGERGVVALRFH